MKKLCFSEEMKNFNHSRKFIIIIIISSSSSSSSSIM